ncbi:hypothetical protein PGT21_003933 [Puccinia graminis f. sp. tritici]|uniref:Uncharacterized protein n=1 Tax=Puccinia graminis f. sp. tritici TaxID=56615 RepID=A0A5B0M8P9_PUCGR|nr:hypothetical protein PGTUg99_014948 [Puccinia graminis f. sp. tritici]KAA1074396.1 hypothetical protein PGT21_003933 [Puccinia graminis f. sp. tritici]
MQNLTLTTRLGLALALLMCILVAAPCSSKPFGQREIRARICNNCAEKYLNEGQVLKEKTLKLAIDPTKLDEEEIKKPCWGTGHVCTSMLRVKLLQCNQCHSFAWLAQELCSVHGPLDDQYFHDPPASSSNP